MKSLSLVLATFASSLVTSLVFAYTFRFPILRAGYVGPFGDYSPYGLSLSGQMEILSLVAVNWFQWGVLGNFLALLVIGLLLAIIGRKFRLTYRHLVVMVVIGGVLPNLYLALYDVLSGI